MHGIAIDLATATNVVVLVVNLILVLILVLILGALQKLPVSPEPLGLPSLLRGKSTRASSALPESRPVVSRLAATSASDQRLADRESARRAVQEVESNDELNRAVEYDEKP